MYMLLAYGTAILLSLALHLVIYFFSTLSKTANKPIEVKVVGDDKTEELLKKIESLEKKLDEKKH